MTAPPVERLLAQLRHRNIRLVRGERHGEVALVDPDKARTPALMEAVKAFKPDLVRIVWPDPDMPGDDARPDIVTTDPKPLPTTAPPKSEWETCTGCRAEVLAAEMPAAMALCDTPSRCPYRPAEAATPYERPSAPSSPSGPARPLLTSRPPPPAPRPDLFAG